MDDVTRWVNLTFVFFGLLLWWFFARLAETVMGWIDVQDEQILGENLTQASLYGLVLGVGLAIFLWRHKRLYEFGLNVAKEVKKVTWPTFDETKSATRTVIVTTLIIAAILASFDFVFQKLTAMILGVDS